MQLKNCLILTEEDVEDYKPTLGVPVDLVLVPLAAKEKWEAEGNRARLATHPLTNPPGKVVYYTESHTKLWQAMTTGRSSCSTK